MKEASFCTDGQPDPLLLLFSIITHQINGTGPCHTVLLYMVVRLHKSLTKDESFTLTLDLLRWQWKPYAIPEVLSVTLLSQVHPNAQKLCHNQGLDSDTAVL